MAFWKKSDDPWDRPPAPPSRPDVPQEPEKGLADQLREWNESRKAEKARKLAESTPAPILCPWCGKEMEVTYIRGGRDGVYWQRTRPSVGLTGDGDVERLDTDGGILNSYKYTWYCKDCRRLVLDLPRLSPEQAERLAQTMDTQSAAAYLEQAQQREGDN